MYNEISLVSLCASLCEIMGIDQPRQANKSNPEFVAKVKESLCGCADRIVMFNPDAIGEWIYRKYPNLLSETSEKCDFELPLKAVMPSVTPVCFGTMYTGAEPSIHGIKAYTKPVIKIDTIFDALIRAKKRPVIIVTENDSLSKIYLERDMDYFIFPTVEEVIAKAFEVIVQDKYDFIVIYDKSYDETMHKFGPESVEALSEIKANSRTFSSIVELIKSRWKDHNTLIGFAMDHGCHEIDGGMGSHGLEMEEVEEMNHIGEIEYKKSMNILEELLHAGNSWFFGIS